MLGGLINIFLCRGEHSLDCIFLVTGEDKHSAGHAMVSGNTEVTSIHHQQKRIRQDRDSEFSVSFAQRAKNFETADLVAR